jgi:hypothetical protein
MMWALYIGAGLVGLFILFLVWDYRRLLTSRRQARAEITRVELGHIDALTAECVDIFKQKLGLVLDLSDVDDAAEKLDAAFLDRTKLKNAFAKEGFYWYFVKPVGAALGEVLCRHAKYEWRKVPGQAPHLEIAIHDGTSEAHPFDKVIKQAVNAEAGDLAAYIEFARTVDQVMNEGEGE